MTEPKHTPAPSTPRAAKPAPMDNSPIPMGYLVPEFPGQTHYFFWREIRHLQELGCKSALVSTRPPPDGIRSPYLTKQTTGQVDYIWPFRLADIPNAIAMVPRLQLSGLTAALRNIGAKCNGGFKNRVRLALLALMAIKLAAIANRRAWSHVHVHSCGDAANIALFAHLLFRITYSLTLHNPIGVYGGNQPAKFRHARFAIFITDAIRSDATAVLGEELPAAVFVAPMGVNTDDFRRRTPFAAPIAGAPFRIFCCARLNPAKGHAILIEAVAKLLGEGRDVTLTMAGEDDAGGNGYRNDLVELTERLGIGPHVRFLGAVDETRVRDELESCSIFVLASFAEPLGIAIMEAMSMEVPVISTAAGGVMSLIDNGEDGILVPPGSSDALAQAIARLADQPELASRLAKRGRERAEREFSAIYSARTIFEGLHSTMPQKN